MNSWSTFPWCSLHQSDMLSSSSSGCLMIRLGPWNTLMLKHASRSQYRCQFIANSAGLAPGFSVLTSATTLRSESVIMHAISMISSFSISSPVIWKKGNQTAYRFISEKMEKMMDCNSYNHKTSVAAQSKIKKVNRKVEHDRILLHSLYLTIHALDFHASLHFLCSSIPCPAHSSALCFNIPRSSLFPATKMHFPFCISEFLLIRIPCTSYFPASYSLHSLWCSIHFAISWTWLFQIHRCSQHFTFHGLWQLVLLTVLCFFAL